MQNFNIFYLKPPSIVHLFIQPDDARDSMFAEVGEVSFGCMKWVTLVKQPFLFH